jgi:hypothetical protein
MEKSRSASIIAKKTEKNVEKVGMFFAGRLAVVSNHTFTTTPPRFTTQFTTFCASKNAGPLQKRHFHHARKNYKI